MIGSAEVMGLSKTFIGVHVQRSTTRFLDNTEFKGVSLHDELNREATTKGLTPSLSGHGLDQRLVRAARAQGSI